jgi:transposase
MPGPRRPCSEKTDSHDAQTQAQLVRIGWYREGRVKGWAAHLIRRLVGARAQMVGISIDLSNQIRSTLKTFGLRASGGAGRAFEVQVRAALEGRPDVASVVEPLLAAWRAIRDQVAALHRRLIKTAKEDATCRLLMTWGAALVERFGFDRAAVRRSAISRNAARFPSRKKPFSARFAWSGR